MTGLNLVKKAVTTGPNDKDAYDYAKQVRDSGCELELQTQQPLPSSDQPSRNDEGYGADGEARGEGDGHPCS